MSADEARALKAISSSTGRLTHSERQWLIDEGYTDELAAFVMKDGTVEPDREAFLDSAVREVRARREAAVTAEVRDKPIDDMGDDRESLRRGAISLAKWAVARADENVLAWRKTHLDQGHLEIDEVPAWVD